MENNISKNIRSLRKAYGETQFELALAVGLDSPNSISNYEKGIRTPEIEIINKIAVHYRITENELINSDFSQVPAPTAALMDKECRAEITCCTFPVICTEKALKNEYFAKGYNAHKRTIEAMKLGKPIDVADCEICFESYTVAFEKENLSEAAANLLWWLLIFEISNKNIWMMEMAESLKYATDEWKMALKKYYLKDMSASISEKNDSNISLQEVENVEKNITEIIKKLKYTTDFSDLADYYLALRYLMGCMRNELTDEMNRSIGAEMMMAFLQLENKYVCQYLIRCKEIIKK